METTSDPVTAGPTLDSATRVSRPPDSIRPMISDAEYASLSTRFPALRGLEPEHRTSFCGAAQTVALDEGATVFAAGARCENFLWLTDGSVRVSASDGESREILLYRVSPGELCVFTTSCALSHASYPAEGRTESPTRAVVLPVGRFEDLIDRSGVLRRLVFASLSERLHEVMGLVESVTFRRLEERVAAWLLEACGGQPGTLERSHQQVADEIGSTREPISRVLAALARAGAIELGRRRITLVDPPALRRHAGH